MGTSHSLGQLGGKLASLAADIERSAGPALRAAAKEAKAAMDVPYGAATGGDFKLSNWRPGPTFRAGYDFLDADSFKMAPRHPGLDTGFGPHLIGAGKAKSGRRTLSFNEQLARPRRTKGRRNSGYLKGGGYGHPVRAPVLHPGAKAKEPFRRGVPIVARRAPEAYQRERLAKPLSRAF